MADARFLLSLTVAVSDPMQWNRAWNVLSALIPKMFDDVETINLNSQVVEDDFDSELGDDESLAKLAVLLRERGYPEEYILGVIATIDKGDLKLKGR
jgi:hypothetical protein